MARQQGYNGNPNLKKVGEQIEWNAHKLSEFMKCAADPIYFAEKYMRIISLDKGLVPFRMYDYQKDIVNSIKDNRNTAVVASRQSGKCCDINTPVVLRNKKTGEILNTTIGEFFEITKTQEAISNDHGGNTPNL